MKTYFIISIILIGTILNFGCQKEAMKTEPITSIDWDSFVTGFIESYFVANPTVGVSAGRHEFDGILPDWSPASLNANIEMLSSQRQMAMAFESSNLSDEQRFEREYLLSIVDKELFQLDKLRLPYNNPIYYYLRIDPNIYISREYAPLEVRMEACTKYANALPKAIEQVMANLKTPMPRTCANLAHTTFGGLAIF